MPKKVPKASVMFSSYSFLRQCLHRYYHGKGDGTPLSATESIKIAAVSGAGGGIAEAFTVTPFQVIKVRLQSREHLQHYKNTWNCLQLILRKEGPRALMNGLG